MQGQGPRTQKKTSFEEKGNGGVVRLSYTPVKGHSFYEEIVALAIAMYLTMGCGLRSVIKGLQLFNQFLGGALGDIPSHQSIENWLIKVGIVEYYDSCKKFCDKDYAIIVDESVTVGSQKALVILAVPAQHEGHALKHKDCEVLAALVGTSWKAEDIEEEILKLIDKIGHAPVYWVSDNGRNIRKGAELVGIPRHRDISHTIGIFMEREYKNREDFKAFTEKLAKIRLTYHLTYNAYLLPPKGRTMARFMNLTHQVDWGWQMLKIYKGLDERLQEAYKFIHDYKDLITELHYLTDAIDFISARFKQEGLSHFTADFCSDYIRKSLICSEHCTDGIKRVGQEILKYIKEEENLLEPRVERVQMQPIDEAHHISSDIIESSFGKYKDMQPMNKNIGITPIILALPLLGKLDTKEDREAFDFKGKLESVRMEDLKDWKNMKLLDNWQVRRMLTFKKAI